jgi:hypothetical protein
MQDSYLLVSWSHQDHGLFTWLFQELGLSLFSIFCAKQRAQDGSTRDDPLKWIIRVELKVAPTGYTIPSFQK